MPGKKRSEELNVGYWQDVIQGSRRRLTVTLNPCGARCFVLFLPSCSVIEARDVPFCSFTGHVMRRAFKALLPSPLFYAWRHLTSQEKKFNFATSKIKNKILI